jgi:hypothetical protein
MLFSRPAFTGSITLTVATDQVLIVIMAIDYPANNFRVTSTTSHVMSFAFDQEHSLCKATGEILRAISIA